ncbi:BRO-N domain-containing protein [Burkholderia ambifaria]|jgi:prophage antirepressor-like protein|uniref:BRO-N domain-containing protein n=1 Tax=Burkholderia ambifaria TaxID=152480 RepID=UPI001ABAF4F3|nr:Bro-N domain-containing protein [Burkholderia ambifaria]
MPTQDSTSAHASHPLTLDFRSTPVRIVVIDDQLWFVGSDVANLLGYSNAADAIRKHCKGVAKRYPLHTTGGTQSLRVLSEADMLRLVVSSKLPAAEVFERWVFEEVLPSIRKTGRYESAAQPSDPDRIDPRTLLLSEQSNLKTELPPKVADAVDRRICATTKCG